MSLATTSPTRRTSDAGRRDRILEAAERVFVARGFHAATMQHVAEAAGMSAGNLYRTFPSKEAIVEGLCARDQQERAANFAKVAEVESVMAAFAAGLRKHVVSRPRAKATLMVEIWSEAARNPAIAAMSRAVDADILTQLERMIEIAKMRGEASPTVNAASVARYIFTYVSGLLQRVACDPEFDGDAEGERAFKLFKALCEGALAPAGTESLR
ncbi:MAG: helix-turn-helix domain-containing protein [Roseiarcus sp.]